MRLKPIIKGFLLTLITLGMSCMPLNAQKLQAALSHYSVDDGLTSNTIAHIIRDDYGYLWIGTWNGLSRFDGFNFFNYETGNASGIPLLHNRIMDMVADGSQNIWMRMYDGHIFVLNRRTDTIINPLEDMEGYEDMVTKYPFFVSMQGEVFAVIEGRGIFAMHFDGDKVAKKIIDTDQLKTKCFAEGYKGELWAGTTRGIHRIDRDKEMLQMDGIFEEENINCMHSANNSIYAGTKSGKILCYTSSQGPKVIAELKEPISSIFIDSHDLIWFAQTAQGISRLDQKTGNVKHFTQDVLVPQFDVTGAVIREENGTVWVGMNHGGFGYYNREADEMEYFHNDPSNPWNLSNTVHAYAPMAEGVIWEGTSRRGLEKLEILKNTIVRKYLYDGDIGFNNEIRAIYYDKDQKKLLIGNKNNSLVIFSENGSRVDIHSDNNGNELGRIYGINKDHLGNYWICTKGNGVTKMTPTAEGYTYTTFRHNEDDPNSLNSDNAYYALEDQDGNIWVATYGGGINILRRGQNGSYTILNHENGLSKYPKDKFLKIRTIALDKEGNVWAGTTDGLLIMSLKDGMEKIEVLENCSDYHYMLGSNDIVCMACDKDGSMWIGTNGGGLSHTIGKDEDGKWMFENFNARDGLPSEEIKSLAFDNRGHVWLATDRMLCSFDTERHIFSTFTIQDGVDDTSCSECGACALPNGDLYFGTIDGYYFVNHKNLTSTEGSQLKLRITDFMLNDEIMTPRTSDIFDYYVPESTYVELPDHNSVFSIRFASLNYQLQHRVHYQYMLEGYDEEWHNADKTRTVTYSGLPAGTYTFKVKAFMLESPDKYDIKELVIKVPPFWLLSTVAVWIYLILISTGIITYFYYKHQRTKKEKARRQIMIDGQRISFSTQEDYEFMKKQMEWLEAHYSDTSMTVEDMISQSTLGHTAYFNTLESFTGMSPKDFLTDFRLKKALQLLDEDSELNMSEIAASTGFNDPVYFTRSFKNKTGLTPSKYREKKLAEQKEKENNQ